MDVQVGSGGLCTILYFLSTPSHLITRVFGTEPGTGVEEHRMPALRGTAQCGHGGTSAPMEQRGRAGHRREMRAPSLCGTCSAWSRAGCRGPLRSLGVGQGPGSRTWQGPGVLLMQVKCSVRPGAEQMLLKRPA